MRVFGRVLAVLLLIGTLGALGYATWNAGFQQGIVESVETTTEVVVTTPYYPGFGAFGFFWIFKLFFVFLFIGLIAKFIFGPRRWSHRGWGPGGPPESYRSKMEERLTEWHRDAHDERAPPEGH